MTSETSVGEADLAALASLADPDDPTRLHPAVATLMALGVRWIRIHISEQALPLWGPEHYAGRLGKIKSVRSTEQGDLLCIKWRKHGESVARPSEVVYAPWPEDGPSLAEHRLASGTADPSNLSSLR